jgi:hypothetical protein
VLSFLSDTGFFRPDEIDIAREVLDSRWPRAERALSVVRR